MPKPTRPRFQTWIEPATTAPIAPEIRPQLETIILEFALLEDMTGPKCSMVDDDKYVVEGAGRLRESIVRALQGAEISVSDEHLTMLCRDTASEAFIIRLILDAKITGEMCKTDIISNPFYKTYQAYFDQAPELVIRTIALALEAAAGRKRKAENN
jgi:hypothetical protein